MKRQSVLLGLLIAVLLGGGIWWFTTQYSPKPKKSATNSSANANIAQELKSSVTYQGVDGKNAMELLKGSHEVIETDGFVKAIDGRMYTKTTYWMMYVNGKQAEVGAKDYVTKSTDSIEWKFEAVS